MHSTHQRSHLIYKKPDASSRIFRTIKSLRNHLSSTQHAAQSSHPLSGIISSGVNPSTLTTFLPVDIPSPKTRNMSSALVNLNYLSVPQSLCVSSTPMENGQLPGIGPSEQSSSSSPIGVTNCKRTEYTSTSYLPHYPTPTTYESSITTKQCGLDALNTRTSCSVIPLVSPTCMSYGSRALSLLPQEIGLKTPNQSVMIHASVGTSLGAPTTMYPAHIDTSARNVNNLDTLHLTVGNSDDKTEQQSFPMPSFLQNFVWDGFESLDDTLAITTEHIDPLLQPPANEFRNRKALTTIRNNPHLFAIITPIHVHVFRSYLTTHPNQPFILSVCQGLISGFWPWADTDDESRPTTWDNSSQSWGANSDAHFHFIQQQCTSEVLLQRFSPAFGPDLLLLQACRHLCQNM